MPKALAIFAHPDDIEFQAAGTLLLLGQAGYELHYMNLANGNCGSNTMGREETARVRLTEAHAAADILGAVFHPPLANDLDIFYERELLARVASVFRQVAPDILLTHSPSDYMEDHENTCRLAVSAAFVRCIPNFPCEPTSAAIATPVAIYHAQPHGNHDPLNHGVVPDYYVNIESVLEQKQAALAAHRSQQEWLDVSQGMNSYLREMVSQGQELGRLSGCFSVAEGWRRHNPRGFSGLNYDPLARALGGNIKWQPGQQA